MTFTGVAPGRTSLRALEWLARVGASPSLPLQLVMGCSERVARDHVRRLETAGLVQRTAMRRGDGALVMVTRAGALEAGHPARRALRSLSPTGWAHASACAWVSAWLHLRGREWISEREMLDDDFWRFDLRYQDHRGTVRRTHRPDLGVHTCPVRWRSRSSYNRRPPPGCAGSAGCTRSSAKTTKHRSTASST